MERDRVPRRRYEQARARLTDHYIRHAKAADVPFRPPGEAVPTLFEGREQALAWFDAERENLLATTHAHARTRTALALGFALGRYLSWRLRLQDLLTVRVHALAACQALGDAQNLASAWTNLGTALNDLKRYPEALAAHQTALKLCQPDNTVGRAGASGNLGTALKHLKRYPEALVAHQTALELFQQTDDTSGQAGAWHNFGIALKDLKRYPEALAAHQTALELFQQTDDTNSQGVVSGSLGTAHRDLEQYAEAIVSGERAVAMLTEDEDWVRVGEAWAELATTLNASGAEPPQVREAWEQSAAAYILAGDDEAAATSRAKAGYSEEVAN
jgi:tetratricopeptide (TPR) repeat protein